MQYLISTCNCTVDFIYPSGNNPQCKLSDLKCLVKNNGGFDQHMRESCWIYSSIQICTIMKNRCQQINISQIKNREWCAIVYRYLIYLIKMLMKSVTLSIDPKECDTIDYAVDVTPLKGSELVRHLTVINWDLKIFNFLKFSYDTDDQILVDVHFQRSTIFKYRTDIVFDWLDLMGLDMVLQEYWLISYECFCIFISWIWWNCWIISWLFIDQHCGSDILRQYGIDENFTSDKDA